MIIKKPINENGKKKKVLIINYQKNDKMIISLNL